MLFRRISVYLTSFLFLAALSVSLAASAQTVYAVTDDRHFGMLDLSTGVYSEIATTSPRFYALTFASADTLYGVATDSQLYSINPATGATTSIGGFSPTLLTRLAADSSGTLFADSNTSQPGSVPPPATLFELNPSNAATTLIGGTGLSGTVQVPRGALTFDTEDTLYTLVRTDGMSNYSLATRNTSTGTATVIGDTGFGTSARITGLVSSNDTLYGIYTADLANTSEILTFNKTTGAATQTGIAPTIANISGLAVRPVPAPNGLLTALTAIVPGILLLRRRK